MINFLKNNAAIIGVVVSIVLVVVVFFFFSQKYKSLNNQISYLNQKVMDYDKINNQTMAKIELLEKKIEYLKNNATPNMSSKTIQPKHSIQPKQTKKSKPSQTKKQLESYDDISEVIDTNSKVLNNPFKSSKDIDKYLESEIKEMDEPTTQNEIEELINNIPSILSDNSKMNETIGSKTNEPSIEIIDEEDEEHKDEDVNSVDSDDENE